MIKEFIKSHRKWVYQMGFNPLNQGFIMGTDWNITGILGDLKWDLMAFSHQKWQYLIMHLTSKMMVI